MSGQVVFLPHYVPQKKNGPQGEDLPKAHNMYNGSFSEGRKSVARCYFMRKTF